MRRALAAAAFLCSGLSMATVAAAQITVMPGNLGPWQEQNVACAGSNTGATGFQTGPATPPLGTGSGRLTVGSNSDSLAAFPYTSLHLVFLSQLTELSYGTYVQTDGSGGSKAPYLILELDYDADAAFDDTLFFEPQYQGGLAVGTWQSWNARTGGWWSSIGTAGTSPGTVQPLSAFLALFPDAQIVNRGTGEGGLRVAAGCNGTGWDGFDGNFDNVRIGVNDKTTAFDFEGAPPVITIDDLAQAEGSGGGLTDFVLTLNLSAPVSDIVTVDYTLAPGSATAPGDYLATGGTAIFAPQQQTTTITVQVVADDALEPDETFFVDLSNPQLATIGDGQAQGTIQNDDTGPVFADLAIVKTGPATVDAGDPVTYTLTVTNNGPSAASGVTVTDTLPAGTTFVSATPGQGSCSGTATVTCQLGGIASGASVVITLVVQAPSGGGPIVNSATVSNQPETDGVGSNDSATATTQVVGGPPPPPAAIPALSTWGLLALIAALAGLALRRLR